MRGFFHPRAPPAPPYGLKKVLYRTIDAVSSFFREVTISPGCPYDNSCREYRGIVDSGSDILPGHTYLFERFRSDDQIGEGPPVMTMEKSVK